MHRVSFEDAASCLRRGILGRWRCVSRRYIGEMAVCIARAERRAPFSRAWGAFGLGTDRRPPLVGGIIHPPAPWARVLIFRPPSHRGAQRSRRSRSASARSARRPAHVIRSSRLAFCRATERRAPSRVPIAWAPWAPRRSGRSRWERYTSPWYGPRCHRQAPSASRLGYYSRRSACALRKSPLIARGVGGEVKTASPIVARSRCARREVRAPRPHDILRSGPRRRSGCRPLDSSSEAVLHAKRVRVTSRAALVCAPLSLPSRAGEHPPVGSSAQHLLTPRLLPEDRACAHRRHAGGRPFVRERVAVPEPKAQAGPLASSSAVSASAVRWLPEDAQGVEAGAGVWRRSRAPPARRPTRPTRSTT